MAKNEKGATSAKAEAELHEKAEVTGTELAENEAEGSESSNGSSQMIVHCDDSPREFFSKFFDFGWGALPPRPLGFWLGGQSPSRPHQKRSSAAFDRGGQTGPPRSNDFFFGTADDAGAADDRPAGPERTMGLPHLTCTLEVLIKGSNTFYR